MRDNHYLFNSEYVPALWMHYLVITILLMRKLRVRKTKYITFVGCRGRIGTQVCLINFKPELFSLDKGTQINTDFS